MANLKVKCVDSRPFLKAEGERLAERRSDGNLSSLTLGKVYEVLSVERGWYRIVDDTEEDYLYPPYLFEALN
jgi:hypothetical protein